MPSTFSFDLTSRELFSEELELIDFVADAVRAGGGRLRMPAAKVLSSRHTVGKPLAAKALPAGGMLGKSTDKKVIGTDASTAKPAAKAAGVQARRAPPQLAENPASPKPRTKVAVARLGAHS